MKTTQVVIGIAAILIIGFLFIHRDERQPSISTASQDTRTNVTMQNGAQVVTINVKGGYSPESSLIQAGVPTILRFQTNGTFDCSSSIRIPSLSVSKNLPATGTTDIPLGSLQKGGTVEGTCAMGMYRFELDVEG